MRPLLAPLLPLLLLLLLLLGLAPVHAAKEPEPQPPCTIKSPTMGYYDLNSMAVRPLPEGKKSAKDARQESWHARGYDYGANFTLNFCSPVIERLENVDGVDKGLWQNVSAYYRKGDRTYSIGQLSTSPVLRGRRLVLNYTMGSPCDADDSTKRELISGGDDGDDDDKKKKKAENDKEDKDHDKSKASPSAKRRKSTIISFVCNQEPLAPKAAVSYVGVSPDDCTYFFEARSPAACPGANIARSTIGPGGVFGIIALIALVVYLLGGVAYQRTVMHQRGWRQLPNYGMWAAAVGFFKDMLLILFSSCARLLPSRSGYNQLPTHTAPGRSRFARNEDENRLIDQLDEEWDD